MQATLIATLSELPQGDSLRRLSGVADWLEVRADRVGMLGLEGLRREFSGRLLFTLRSRAEGGSFEGSTQDRLELLAAAAAAGFDAVDLEADRDLVPAVLAAVPGPRRVISWHGPPASVAQLADRLDASSSHQALCRKLVPEARSPGDELAPLELLRSLGRRDVVAFASGGIGSWTRRVAPRLGLPWVFAAAGDTPGAPGQPTLGSLREDDGFPQLRPLEALFGIVGDAVEHSLSPRLHNAAYRALDLPYHYLAFEVHQFAEFWLELIDNGTLDALGFPLRGLSVTAPYKEAVLAVAGAASPLVERIGGGNTLVRTEGVWEADTTDPAGVLGALARRGVAVQGRSIAVVGCGGAGKAAAAGLALAGARVVLVNRDEARGRAAGEALALPYVPLQGFDPGAFDVVVQATSLGRRTGDRLPFDAAGLRPGAFLLDLVYTREPGSTTPLVARARARGLAAEDGRVVLLEQAKEQFRLMTGRAWPESVGARELELPEAGRR